MRKTFAKAGIISALVSLVVVLGNSILFAQATSYAPGVGAKELEGLKYFEAVALLESRAHHSTGLSAFLDSAGSFWYWESLLVSWAVLGSICFICCVLFTHWARTDGA
jgi:hypothetical protein